MRHQLWRRMRESVCTSDRRKLCYIPNPFNVITSHFLTSQGMIFYIICRIHQFSYCLYLVKLINVWAYTTAGKRKEKKPKSISWHGNKRVKRQITVLWGIMHWTIFCSEKQLPAISSGCWAIAQRQQTVLQHPPIKQQIVFKHQFLCRFIISSLWTTLTALKSSWQMLSATNQTGIFHTTNHCCNY